MHSVLLAPILSVLLVVCSGAVTPSSGDVGVDADPNTHVPRTWKEYKKFCKLNVDPSTDAAQKATFLSTIAKVKGNQQQQAIGNTEFDFVGMSLNCHAHLTPEEFRKGALGYVPTGAVRRSDLET